MKSFKVNIKTHFMNFNFLLDAVKGVFSKRPGKPSCRFPGWKRIWNSEGAGCLSIPVSLAGIWVNKAQSAPESVFSFAKEAFSSGITNKIGDAFRPGGGGIPSIGPSLITSVLGDKFGSLSLISISDFAGLKGSSVSSLCLGASFHWRSAYWVSMRRRVILAPVVYHLCLDHRRIRLCHYVATRA